MKRQKKLTEHRVACECGAKAAVFQLAGGRFMAHCVACGSLCFFDNPILLERLSQGGDLCHHTVERRPCRGGWTTWCRRCRVRRFYYDGGG
ncbi:MAG: hypothetical protein HY672_01450 [Chloroflexi bacterium]|nr:hypothetical protein [Chloroflexota bacterium]